MQFKGRRCCTFTAFVWTLLAFCKLDIFFIKLVFTITQRFGVLRERCLLLTPESHVQNTSSVKKRVKRFTTGSVVVVWEQPVSSTPNTKKKEYLLTVRYSMKVAAWIGFLI